MKNILKNALQYLILAIPFTVLLVPASFFFPFITGKAFFFRIVVELALGLTLALMVYDPSVRPKRSVLFWCLSIFTAVIFFADVFSPDPARAFWSNFERMEGFVTLAHLFAYFFILISLFREKKDWNKLFYVCATVSYFLILFGFLQLSREIAINQSSDRVDGTLGNAAYFAIFLIFQIFVFALLWWRSEGSLKGIAKSAYAAFFIFVAYYLWHISGQGITAEAPGITLSLVSLVAGTGLVVLEHFTAHQKLKRMVAHTLFALGIILNVVLLYFTETRGAILGFIGGVGLASLYLLFVHRENKRIRKVAGIFLAGIVVLVLGFLSVKNLPAVKNDPVLGRFASISWNETKDQARSYVWPMAIKGSMERPILGWGQEGFLYVFDKDYNPAMWSQEPWFDRAHNSFLDWLVAGGILGFLGYVSLFAAALYLVIKKRPFDVFEKALIVGLLAAYAFNNLFVFDNLISYIFFFTVLAMIHSESLEGESVSSKNAENPHMLAGIVIVLSLLTVYFVNWDALMQNRTLIQALSVAGVQNGNLVSCTKVSYQKDSTTGESKQVCDVWYPTLDLFRSALSYNAFGNSEVREHFTRISTEINQQASVSDDIKSNIAQAVITQFDLQAKETPMQARPFLFMGSYLSSVGLYDQAIADLAKAQALSPKKQQILFSLGQAYLSKGDVAKSNSYFKQAYDLAPEYPDAEAFYAISSLAIKDTATFEKILASLEAAGIADQRIVSTLVSSGKKAEAIEYVKKALLVNPDNTTAQAILVSLQAPAQK